MNKMKILTVANRKGGAGKSTCAAHLAVEAVRRNYKTLLIDLDPQKTLEHWWHKREEENPYLADVDPMKLIEKIEQIKDKGFDLCIIDTPGDMSINAELGIEVANLVIIPSKPTAPDLRAIGRTIHEVNKSEKPFVFVVTQTISRTTSAIKAISTLAGFGPVAPATMGNRVAYAHAMGDGSSAADVDSNAATELAEIWSYIEPRLFEKSKEHSHGGKEKI